MNAASFKRQGSTVTLARGSIISIFGEGLARTTAYADRLPLPTLLAGTEVLVADFRGAVVAAPLFYVSATQINAQMPYEIQLTSPSVSVRRDGVASNSVTVYLDETDAGGFTVLQNGGGPGYVLHANGSLVTPQMPVRPGEYLTLYATGLGAVDPKVPSGQAAQSSPLSNVIWPMTVRLGFRSIPASFAGLAPGFVGLYQVNFQVPTDFTAPTPSVVLQPLVGRISPTFSAGGPGLVSVNTSSAPTGSPNLPLIASGINLPPTATLNFGGRRLTSSVPNSQTISAAVPATALRVAGPVPIFVSTADPNTGSSNSLDFQVTGATIPGTAPTISNLSVTPPSSTGNSASIAFDFQDPDGDIVYNGGLYSVNAKVEIKVGSCGTVTQAGTVINRPDQTSGRLSFSLLFIGGGRITTAQTFEIILIDQAGNRSNKLSTTVSSWIC